MPVDVRAIAHVGIRVHDLARSVAFYEHLGFRKTLGPVGPEPVAILMHPAGIEINLIVNALDPAAPNILMDVPDKHPGYTHIALLVPDLDAARATVEAAGIPLSGGPIQFYAGVRGFFIRDPDRNVIEIHENAGR